MKRIYLSMILLPFILFIEVEASTHKSLEIPQIKVIPIKDTQSDRQYELFVKLPEAYSDNSETKYPVIYFTDAIWHIELLSAATNFMMEDAILVGISWQKNIDEELKKEEGAHVSRYRDYSIRQSSNPETQAKFQLGQASNHLRFIRNNVFDYIESKYRTLPDNRTYFGFSLGGLFGAYTLLAQPDTFKNYILGSPSIWTSAPYLFSLENAALKQKAPEINVFISYGELEKELSQHLEAFITRLKNKKYQALSSINHIVIESAGHSDSFPMVGVHSVKWLSNLQIKGDK